MSDSQNPSAAPAALTSTITPPAIALPDEAIVTLQPSREITSHQVNPANDRLTITATDERGAGGAFHRYEIAEFNGNTNASRLAGDPKGCIVVLFQNGPINEFGVNGVTQEALLAIVAHRLECFQAGPY